MDAIMVLDKILRNGRGNNESIYNERGVLILKLLKEAICFQSSYNNTCGNEISVLSFRYYIVTKGDLWKREKDHFGTMFRGYEVLVVHSSTAPQIHLLNEIGNKILY